MKYSKTYIFQLAQFISFGLVLMQVQIDPTSIETALTVIATIFSGVMVLYGRYVASKEITILGFKK